LPHQSQQYYTSKRNGIAAAETLNNRSNPVIRIPRQHHPAKETDEKVLLEQKQKQDTTPQLLSPLSRSQHLLEAAICSLSDHNLPNLEEPCELLKNSHQI
jgi:hypothetical protein